MCHSDVSQFVSTIVWIPLESLDDNSIRGSRNSRLIPWRLMRIILSERAFDEDFTRTGHNNGYITLDVREMRVSISIEVAKSFEEIP
jgi:hypothetical protein